MLTAGYYFVSTWRPQLIKATSGDAGSGALASIMVGVGSVVGASLFGAFGLRPHCSAVASSRAFRATPPPRLRCTRCSRGPRGTAR
ncbi:hypothetical protein ROP_27280 [Rhodococcus opacus B4]|uniref:Uncharacterized protein n=1 Tax=Rhodococcus opacus (strain B4) TaxID=632772 RepID=C1B549_RHOOB|nr:hypothetical protein ROP_27280 [Rhodococcus opacus B4]